MVRLIPLLVLLLVGTAASGASHEQSAGDARQVRVAGGTMMEHAASSKSSAEWAEQRPDFERLKPRKRDD